MFAVTNPPPAHSEKQQPAQQTEKLSLFAKALFRDSKVEIEPSLAEWGAGN